MARIGIIAPRQITYSETFIRAHVERMREGVVALSPQELHSLWHGRDLLPVPSFWRILAAFVPPRSGWNPEAALIAKARQRFFRRKGIDCVLAEYGTIGSAWTDLLAQAGIPHVVHFHGYDAYVSSVLEERRDAYARMFRQCAAIVAVSHDMVEQLIGLGAPPEKVRYNPYGVDCELFSQTSPEKNPPLFVGVGRFVEKKAPYLVILAFRQVLEEHPEARLQLIGEGPLFGLCTDLVRELGLGHAVQLPGRLSHAEVASALTGARAFVQHSVRACDGDSEGTPVAILEAGAVGLPVVATRHAGIKDVVTEGETGLLVDEREVVGMAECMLQLARDPELAGRLGAAARRRIRSEFTMEQSIARLADIMEDARVCRPTVVHAVPANASRSVRQRWQRLLARAKRRALGYVLGVLKAVVPDRHWALVSKARHFGFSRYCPICESRLRRFRPYGIVPRLEALCPVCGSLERHRVAWLYLRSKTDLFDGRAKSVLHIGPESAIASRLSGAPGIRYLSVDLSSPLAMVRMDITDLALPDRSFDVVCCSHVLEHVPEDRKALAEVHRVLKPGGWALIQVPLYGEETVEAPGMSDPGERARAFDQHDHFRKYGRDIMERLMEAGLSATLDESMARLSVQRRRRMGLRHASLFVCRKEVGGAAGRLSRARGPLISVIVPAHNAEPYLEQAAQSALEQPRDLELILIEDGSTDGTLRLCERLTAQSDRVHLFRHAEGRNRGPGASRNVGLRMARGKYVAFLDADDYYLPNRFDRDIEMMEADASIEGVYGAVRTQVDPDAPAGDRCMDLVTVDGPIDPGQLLAELVLARRGRFCTDGITVRREVFDKTGLFDEDLLQGQDSAMWLKMAACCRLLPGSIVEPIAVRRRCATTRSTPASPLWHDARCAPLSAVLRWAETDRLGGERIEMLRRALLHDMLYRRLPDVRNLTWLRRHCFRTAKYGRAHPELIPLVARAAWRSLAGRVKGSVSQAPALGSSATGPSCAESERGLADVD